MGQQPGLPMHGLGRVAQIVQGGVEAERSQPLAGRLVAQFRLLAQGEQGFLAAHCRTVAGGVEHLVDGHVGRLNSARHLGEGAIVADVPAQVGQGNENLARIGDDVAKALVAQRCGDFGECPGVLPIG